MRNCELHRKGNVASNFAARERLAAQVPALTLQEARAQVQVCRVQALDLRPAESLAFHRRRLPNQLP